MRITLPFSKGAPAAQKNLPPKIETNAGEACDHFKPPQLNNAAMLLPLMLQN